MYLLYTRLAFGVGNISSKPSHVAITLRQHGTQTIMNTPETWLHNLLGELGGGLEEWHNSYSSNKKRPQSWVDDLYIKGLEMSLPDCAELKAKLAGHVKRLKSKAEITR